jgi:hypothetical protein
MRPLPPSAEFLLPRVIFRLRHSIVKIVNEHIFTNCAELPKSLWYVGLPNFRTLGLGPPGRLNIVVIGHHMDHDAVRAKLDACTLDDAEFGELSKTSQGVIKRRAFQRPTLLAPTPMDLQVHEVIATKTRARCLLVCSSLPCSCVQTSGVACVHRACSGNLVDCTDADLRQRQRSWRRGIRGTEAS